MIGTAYPSDLSEIEWLLIAPLIPPAKPGGRPRDTEMRAVLNGIFYVLRTGCGWEYLPHEYPLSNAARQCTRHVHPKVPTMCGQGVPESVTNAATIE
jgi:transposase